MKLNLEIRLLGTIVGAILLFFVITAIAARINLHRDLMALGDSEVRNGARAYSGYWTSDIDQVRLLVTQDAVSDALRKALEQHDVKTLQDQLANIARATNLSFLTVVDTHGNVIARANGSAPGSLASDPYVRRALTGETVSTAAILPPSELAPEGLAPQAVSDVKNARGNVVEHIDRGLAVVAAAPMSNSSERTIGAIYGGILMNHFYDLVDHSAQALGGAVAILEGDAIISSTISNPDGTRVLDVAVPVYDTTVRNGQAYTGTDTEGGSQYLVRIEPIKNDQGEVIGALWYGIPLAQITDIISHTTGTFVFWGIVAMVLALAFSVPLVERLARILALRSKQVRTAAKELEIVIVGSEVSGDQVTAAKQAVERSGALIAEVAAAGDPSGKVAELKKVNDELHDDMIVLDTLSLEMNKRMQQAVERVHDLNDVARGLNELVTGESG